MELFDQFVDVLAQVDHLLLLETYAAGEAPIEGASGSDLYKQLQLKTEVSVRFIEDISGVPEVLEAELLAGDFLITQGAGETAQLARNLAERWSDRRIT